MGIWIRFGMIRCANLQKKRRGHYSTRLPLTQLALLRLSEQDYSACYSACYSTGSDGAFKFANTADLFSSIIC